MRFHHELSYAAAPEDVYAMLAEPAFREKTVEAQRGRDFSVTVKPSGRAMTVLVDQSRPAEDLPGFAKKFVGDKINIVQKETWSDHVSAELDLTIPGTPSRLIGTITIQGDQTGSVQVVDGDLKVRVPLLGGKLESLVAGLLSKALDVEQSVGRDWLAGHR